VEAVFVYVLMYVSSQEVNILLFQFKIHDILYECPEQRNSREEDKFIDRWMVWFAYHRDVEIGTECYRRFGRPRRRITEEVPVGCVRLCGFVSPGSG
jgi:hypothetical protein